MSEKFDVIYCPFVEVKIENIGSELLENIGSFPIFVLRALRNGNTTAEISESVCLDIITVTSVVDELKKNDLLEKECEDCKLTDLGYQYLRIFEFIKKFREGRDQRYAINCFTCQLEDVKDQRCFLRTDEVSLKNAPHLPNKLKGSEQLIRTPNYENVKEYMKPYLNLSDVALTEDDYDYIQFELKAESKCANKYSFFYVPYEIPPESYLWDNSKVNPEYKFWAEIPIQSAKRRFYSSDLHMLPSGEKIAELLLQLNKLAPKFVSELGGNIISNLENIDKWNKESRYVFIDCYSGQKFEGGLTEIKCPRAVARLSKRKTLSVSTANLKDMKGFLYNYVDSKFTYTPVQIDFKILTQKEDDD